VLRRLAIAAAAAGLAVGAGATTARPSGQASATMSVSSDVAHPRAAIPPRFLGLSLEARDLPTAARLAATGDLVGLLRSLGPGLLRFGGNSVDATTGWSDGAARHPRWARVLVTPADLDGIAALARATGWRVVLAVTLGHPDASAAAREVAAARARLGQSLAAVEIGNEPDQYVEKGLRRRPWGYRRYIQQVTRYLRAIRAVAPGVRVAGPDLASAKPSRWLSRYARAERPTPLTAHFYPLIRCGPSRPTIGKLLSPDLHASEERILGRLVALARTRHAPLRIGETNNVACSGQPGVSDTYASTLWALDYVVRALDAGVSGLNFHGFLGRCRTYTPICAGRAPDLRAGRLSARPEWYALLMARSLAGSRRLATTVTSGRRDVVALAVLTPARRVEVLIVDEGPRATRVTLRLPPRFRSAAVVRLAARALASRGGVTLGGRPVASDGRWSPGRVERVTRGRGGVTVDLPGYSAAMMSAQG
jgi:hypothetical protein